MTPALAFVDLHKTYRGGTRALQGMSLEVPKGSFFGLLGLNGAGKTTCINAVAGLVRPSSGHVEVHGFDAQKQYRQAHRLLGIAPQEIVLDGRFLNVRNILVYNAGYFGMSKRQANRRADELLQTFALWSKRHDRVQELSGGMKRRLNLAKALVHDPDILILDEPTAGADVALRHQIWDELRRLNALGKTVLLTTHYLEEAERLCDEVAVLHQGRVVRSGKLHALIHTTRPDHVLIHTDPPLKAVPQGCPPRCHATLIEGALRVEGALHDDFLLKLLASLPHQGTSVRSVTVQKATLEETFLDLVQHSEEER